MSGSEKSRRNVSIQEAPEKSEVAGLDERMQAHIGVQLRSMYDAYLNEPIPDRIVELLEKLDEISKQDKEDRGGGASE
jgi:hypothetical protein